MGHPTTSGWWRAVAAMLVVALTMAGARPAPPQVAASVEVLPGVHAMICHAGQSDAPGDPAAPVHDCCDACALLSAAVLPEAPRPTRPVAVVVPAEHGRASAWFPPTSRQRSPRQSRAPPRA